eukprot:scaffold106191_cov17-Tisochrysis_lutea.AAC.4
MEPPGTSCTWPPWCLCKGDSPAYGVSCRRGSPSVLLLPSGVKTEIQTHPSYYTQDGNFVFASQIERARCELRYSHLCSLAHTG